MQGALKINPEGQTHQILLTENDDLIWEEEEETLSEQELPIIKDIITKFAPKKTYDLEVITTTDYVAQQLKANGEPWDYDRIIAGVKRIKGDKFTRENRRSNCYSEGRRLNGTVVHRSASYKDLQLLSKRKTLLWERRGGVSSSA